MRTIGIALLIIINFLFGFYSGLQENQEAFYPETAIVSKIIDDDVYVETANGHIFSFDDREDYEVGDYVSIIMDSKNTESVLDDEIIKIQYSGF